MYRTVLTISGHADFLHLAGLLDVELHMRYGVIQEVYTPYNKIADTYPAVLIYSGKLGVACGCYKPIDSETIEIKRMYVHPDNRKNGLGKTVLTLLETEAKAKGFARAILETGHRQPESLRLYEGCGYTRIPNYEPYMDFVESVCYGKKL